MKKIFLLLTLLSFLQVSALEISNKNINDLKLGKSNPTVKQLQIFLNENGFYDAEEGPGSPDNETEYFGATTVASLKIFQEYSELPITGKMDFATGKAVNAYIKEIADEENESESANYFSEDDSFLDKNAKSLEARYNLGEEIDTYKNDITDIYLGKKDTSTSSEDYSVINPSTNKKASLKELLEGTHKKDTSSSPEKQKTIFQRFFSIFD